MASVKANAQPKDKEGKKRQRVSIACLTCRGKHIRCDGVQPVCGFCQANGTPCNFLHAENKRRPPSKRFVESLQARIRHLEEQLEAAALAPAQAYYEPAFLSDESEREESDQPSLDEDDQDPLAELTGLVGRLNMTDDGQVHYFGSQSSYNLVKRSPNETTSFGQQSRLVQKRGLEAVSQLNKSVSVPPELQEHLLELYWQWQHPWNYIVHKDSFMKSYRGEDDGRHCSPLLMSAIFAVAARFSDRVEVRTDPDDPASAGDAFAEQAKILMLFESEAPTITTVQAAGLLAIRIISDGKEALGWLYAGNATRMAHNLGLHLDVYDIDGKERLSEDDLEVRRVTWWGCYVFDKLFAVGLGRPSSTPKSSITCPKPRIDGGAEYTPWVPPTDAQVKDIPPMGIHSHIASNACHVSDLTTIACEAMDAIYAPNSQLSVREIEEIVTKADVELRSHYAALPSFLRNPASMRTPMLPHVCLLHVLHHAHLILLHKPLIRSRRKQPKPIVNLSVEDGEGEDDMMNTHMKTCRQSAAEITRLLRFYKQQYTLRRIPIAAVHLCFAAAIIHLIDARPSSSNRHQAILHLQTCIEILRDLSAAWCRWSDRTTRAVYMLAFEWYGVTELSELHTCTTEKRRGSSSRSQEEPALRGDDGMSLNMTMANPGVLGQGGPEPTMHGDESFLYFTSTPNYFVDEMLKEWLEDGAFSYK